MLVNDQNQVMDVEDPREEETQTQDKPVSEEHVAEPVTTELNAESSDEDMMSLLDEHFNKFTSGKIVDGVVVSVDERSVLVDIGFKSESAISIREFSSTTLPEVGSRIKVYIDSVEDGSGRLKLSKKKADFYLNLEHLKETLENNGTVSGILRRRVKGGMIVEVNGLEAFLPGSQISTKPIPNLDQFIGKTADFKILKIDEERRNLIVSRKKVLVEEQETRLVELKDLLVQDAELDGEVRNITDYGAFIDLGGIDGLLHITDMSWGHIKHPSDMLNIGDKVKVKVLSFDEDNQKVSLGLKQLVPHPWENIEAKYPEGSNVSGKVVNITNYGAFVELESGVEGLVHVSEMSWTKKIKHPKQMVKTGDTVKAIVLSTNKDDKRISLGMKQMEANPWLTIDERYPIDSTVSGSVKSITPFGVFIEIEEDIEGLVHISDISWTKRIYHPKEVFKKGQKVDVKVLSIDKTLHRIALGVKQLTTDPWDGLDERLPINTEIEARVVKIINKGILVDVELEGNVVEGFVPLSHLSIPGLKKADNTFVVNETLPLKVIELDLENRRLILSVKAYYFGKSDEEVRAFIDRHKNKKAEEVTVVETATEETSGEETTAEETPAE
jgi:small subunit ribosomal protein S1